MNQIRNLAIAIAAGLALAGCAEEVRDTAGDPPEYSARQYMQAINDIARIDDQDSDANRLPGELLAFAEIDRGDVVGDYIMGSGYVTRLLAMAVGSEGKVYAFQPTEFIAFRGEYADEQDETVRRYSDQQGNPVNIFPLRAPLAAPGWPEPLDTIITVMNFHDLYLESMPEGTPGQVAQMLYESLSPGGSLVVVDHLAQDGAGAEAANSVHRMDPELAMAVLTGAGFELEAESDMYSRPGDPRTANVYDETVQGQTAQFAWRFRKPE